MPSSTIGYSFIRLWNSINSNKVLSPESASISSATARESVDSSDEDFLYYVGDDSLQDHTNLQHLSPNLGIGNWVVSILREIRASTRGRKYRSSEDKVW